jgi:hypothetical protein
VFLAGCCPSLPHPDFCSVRFGPPPPPHPIFFTFILVSFYWVSRFGVTPAVHFFSRAWMTPHHDDHHHHRTRLVGLPSKWLVPVVRDEGPDEADAPLAPPAPSSSSPSRRQLATTLTGLTGAATAGGDDVKVRTSTGPTAGVAGCRLLVFGAVALRNGGIWDC